MANAGWRIKDARKTRVGVAGTESGEPMTEASPEQNVGQDSELVMYDLATDEMEVMSHEGEVSADQPEPGDGIGQCRTDDLLPTEKTPNKAKVETKQGLESQEFKSEKAATMGRKRSQSSNGGGEHKAAVARWLNGSEEWLAAGGQ